MSGLSKSIVELSKISNRLGISLLTLPDAKPVVLTGTIAEMVKERKIQKVQPDEIIRSNSGEVLFLYIPDHTFLSFNPNISDIPENRRKVHLFYCSTLRYMEQLGRKYRYIATNNHSGTFPIKYSDGKEENQPLHVCKNCMRLLGGDSFGTYQEFDFKKFAQYYDYAVPWFEGIPKTLYGVDYPVDWKKISYQIRAERNWRCEKCGRDCSNTQYLLDLHHINGIKSDCSRKNLRALCRFCHKKEPLHEHMKNAESFEGFSGISLADF